MRVNPNNLSTFRERKTMERATAHIEKVDAFMEDVARLDNSSQDLLSPKDEVAVSDVLIGKRPGSRRRIKEANLQGGSFRAEVGSEYTVWDNKGDDTHHWTNSRVTRTETEARVVHETQHSPTSREITILDKATGDIEHQRVTFGFIAPKQSSE